MAGLFGRLIGRNFEKFLPGVQKLMAETEKIVGEGVSSGGFVKVKTKKVPPDFSSQIIELKIEPAAMQGSKERLESLVTEAVNNALKKETELLRVALMEARGGSQ